MKDTILLVEDEKLMRVTLEDALKSANYDVVSYERGEEALKAFREKPFDIVVTDVRLPDIDGLDILKEVRQEKNSQVLVITAFGTIRDAVEAMKLGAFDYVAKPFTRAELRGIVKRALHLVAEVEQDTPTGAAAGSAAGARGKIPAGLRTLGGNSWMMTKKDGTVRIGVELGFVTAAGAIENVDLPAVGDVLSQGAVCLQIFSADLRCHTVWSPLSGEVVEVNPKVQQDPSAALQDPYGEGWLLRLRPSKFEAERQVLGL
jgi:CheY-like chemotaxis protein/glycine cleavage system H lipoate-binding protein